MLSSSLRINYILLFSLFGHTACLMRGNETDKLALLQFKSLISEDPFGALEFLERHHSLLRVACGHLQPEAWESHRSRSAIFQARSLKVIQLAHNHLVREIPSELGTIAKLEVLSIRNNYLTGEIPSSIGNLSSLHTLSAAINHLHGSIPGSLGQLKKIRVLEIAAINLSSTIPPSMLNLSTLTVITLTSNHGTHGRLPTDLFTTLPNLQDIGLDANLISGSIPVSISNASNLLRFRAAWNKLSGTVPSLAKLSKLRSLLIFKSYLGTGADNDLDFLSSLGEIPPILGKLQALNVLSLCANNFSGPIPPEIFYLSSLSIFFALSRNSSVGFLPAEVGKLKNLGALDVSENMLSNDIPGTVGACISLEQLHMAGNNFQGPIPSTLISLKSLQWLDLSRNNLSGEIPRFLEGRDMLQLLNLSYNNFEGMVPSDRVFNNASAAFVTGNDKLCGGDVFSFGILLLELFTGKRPTDEMFNESLNLQNFVKKALPGQMGEIIDPMPLEEDEYIDLTMKGNDQDRTNNRKSRVKECLASVFHVGVACSNEQPKERMSIADAVAELSSIRNKLVE
ncbi:receptor kinase-like protein Xa21 [Punica granatum]|uniref:Receptor kinase-like protein Xa21 n=1 Tax=Punica granatum TaxID=22663 RepID=A0A6P8CBM8_PUNGR|nr:receptor kinase-like protein Xa21 [Punica granatum]